MVQQNNKKLWTDNYVQRFGWDIDCMACNYHAYSQQEDDEGYPDFKAQDNLMKKHINTNRHYYRVIEYKQELKSIEDKRIRDRQDWYHQMIHEEMYDECINLKS